LSSRYDPRFGDAFWNSAKYSMMQYLYMMMTSWAIVCDVWYLPPMYRQEGESAIDFANRVKSVIAKQGGLIDLVWDGQLKHPPILIFPEGTCINNTSVMQFKKGSFEVGGVIYPVAIK